MPIPSHNLNELFNFKLPDGSITAPMSKGWLHANYPAEADSVLLATDIILANQAVDRIHADLLNKLTGGATIEERDTWQAKELAARALIADTASVSQTAMLATEAGYLGQTALDVANVIAGKADLFHSLIGLAGGIRSKARIAISAATTEAALSAAIADAQADVAAGLAAFNA